MENKYLESAKTNLKQFGGTLEIPQVIELIKAEALIAIAEELHQLNERQSKEFELTYGFEI